jgi:hypothetical protein
MSIIKHNHQVSCHACTPCFIAMLHIVFHMLHEMMSMLMIKKFCDFVYIKLLKQLKFGKYKLCCLKYAL